MPSSACKTCALDRKSTRLNSSHTIISYAVFCLKKYARFTAFTKVQPQDKGRVTGKVNPLSQFYVPGCKGIYSLIEPGGGVGKDSIDEGWTKQALGIGAYRS